MEKRTMTGMKKREQIQKANKTMFLWVVVASAAVAICLVLSQFLVRQGLFNQKVLNAKSDTNSVLVTNKKDFEVIKTGINKLISDSNLSSLKVAETDTALQVIIDALPTADDRAALATSLQQVVLSRSGVSIDSISVTDQSAAVVDPSATATATESSTPQEILFNVVLVGTYAQIGQAISDMEHSIRPFSVERLQIEGSGAQLRASISAKTFYLPAKTMNLKTEALKP
ncbi:hypothetical protein H7Y40_02540 [Pedobacter sp.]|nr:hypothetical protein [Candidatus Saccharibacteria bacterium]